MKRAVIIIAADGFRDEEFLVPKEVLEKNAIEVKTASTTLDTAKGVLGAKVKPDVLVSTVKSADCDAVILVGGIGASQYWNDPVVHALIKDVNKEGKIVAAICIAPVILAKAGLLKGKRATVWSTDAGQLKVNGAEYTGKNVEQDGTIITAAGPFAAKEFAEAVVSALGT